MPGHFEPPDGPPTPETAAEAAAWSALGAAQLTDARRAAENWRNGLVATIGLIAAVTTIKGPDEISGLAVWATIAVSVALGLASLCAFGGAYAALRAAYGAPVVLTRAALRAAGGFDGYRLLQAAESLWWLRLAKAAAFVTLFLVGTAVGFTWYGPRPTVVTLEIERRSGPSVCGALVESKDGHVDLKPAGSPAVRVDAQDILAIRAVDSCP